MSFLLGAWCTIATSLQVPSPELDSHPVGSHGKTLHKRAFVEAYEPCMIGFSSCLSMCCRQTGSPTSASFAPMTWTPMSSSTRTPGPSSTSTTPRTGSFGEPLHQGEAQLEELANVSAIYGLVNEKFTNYNEWAPYIHLEQPCKSPGRSGACTTSSRRPTPGPQILRNHMRLEGVHSPDFPGRHSSNNLEHPNHEKQRFSPSKNKVFRYIPKIRFLMVLGFPRKLKTKTQRSVHGVYTLGPSQQKAIRDRLKRAYNYNDIY